MNRFAAQDNPLLEVSPYDVDDGNLIGRDPRNVSSDEYGIRGNLLVGFKAIRAKCKDCAGDSNEVRKCVVTDCALWPLRMGSMPKGMKMAREAGE